MPTNYIDAAKYAELTERPGGDATDARIRIAERALDDRIGFWPRVDPRELHRLGDLLGGANPHMLLDYQIEAVQRWCSWHVAWQTENNDNLSSRPSAKAVKLGKFSMTGSEVPARGIEDSLRNFLRPYDAELVDVGMVKR